MVLGLGPFGWHCAMVTGTWEAYDISPEEPTETNQEVLVYPNCSNLHGKEWTKKMRPGPKQFEWDVHFILNICKLESTCPIVRWSIYPVFVSKLQVGGRNLKETQVYPGEMAMHVWCPRCQVCITL